jgi:hypothetical protein
VADLALAPTAASSRNNCGIPRRLPCLAQRRLDLFLKSRDARTTAPASGDGDTATHPLRPHALNAENRSPKTLVDVTLV